MPSCGPSAARILGSLFQPMISICCGLLNWLRLQNNTTKIGREFSARPCSTASLHRGELPLIKQAMPKKMAVSLCVSYDPQGLIGTMLIELTGDPLTNFELTAR
jgi:hypothetical protein